jgi:hypothetical protein
MSKERYNQIIGEVYKNYEKQYSTFEIGIVKSIAGNNPMVDSLLKNNSSILSQQEFINKCKTDPEFSQEWGLKIEEQMLSEERRYNIWFNNNYETGMERFFNPEQLPDYHNPYYTPTPTKEITISYNGEKISFYE